jgi:hypothetical protein
MSPIDRDVEVAYEALKLVLIYALAYVVWCI